MNSKEIIVIVGYGWVGQANALALSSSGHNTYYYDSGKPDLHYTDKHQELYNSVKPLSSALEKDGPNTRYIVCVGDRVSSEGEQDISSIEKALDSIKNTQGKVILRSTIIPGSLSSLKFDYYMPEFLHEKFAVEEAIRPHYFILGSRNMEDPKPVFFKFWESNAVKVFHGTPEEASFLKYLSNTWNALRIAFINEFGTTISKPSSDKNLANIKRVIDFFFEEKSYFKYGKSYGGHCLPKDTRAFCAWSKSLGNNSEILQGMWKSNDAHQALEKDNPLLSEWFSEWVRPEVSGRVALKALKNSIKRNSKRILFKKIL